MVALDQEPVIIIGLDFGTTYSGAAWARSRKPDQIQVITNWETQTTMNADREKSPTVLQYNAPITGLPTSWGYNVPATEAPLKWFKLMLLDPQDLPDDVRHSQQMKEAGELLKKAGITAAEAVGMYLQAFWTHILSMIQRSGGRALFNLSTLKVILTVPAIWPHYAQAKMKEAARIAGILDERVAGPTTLCFVPEPEAAAMATLADMRDRPDVQAGDHFVVCDAGGGTVDIITYEVVRIDPFVVRESIQGDGKLCGGVFLDEAFARAMEKRLDDKMGKGTWARLPPIIVKELLNKEWELGIKSNFDNRSKASWTVQLPFGGGPETNYQSPTIEFSKQEILDVFKPVSEEVVNLVLGQVRGVRQRYSTNPKYVILVGGFGRCRYLYDRLKMAMPDDVEILQGSRDIPWTAICRGAVIKGLSMSNMDPSMVVAVGSRVSRASYGIKVSVPFISGVHDEIDRYWSNEELRYMASEMRWFLKVDDDVSEKKPVTQTFYRLYKKKPTSIQEKFEISGSRSPPTRPDSTVKTLCEVAWSKNIAFNNLPTWTNSNGVTYRKLSFDTTMTTDGASLEFEVYFGGSKVASQNVAVNFGGGTYRFDG